MHARLIYDGACIFCDAYVRLLALREAVGPVELIDARSGDPRLRDGALLSKRPVARFFYPIFKFCRTITLKLRQIPKISGPNTAN